MLNWTQFSDDERDVVHTDESDWAAISDLVCFLQYLIFESFIYSDLIPSEVYSHAPVIIDYGQYQNSDVQTPMKSSIKQTLMDQDIAVYLLSLELKLGSWRSVVHFSCFLAPAWRQHTPCKEPAL